MDEFQRSLQDAAEKAKRISIDQAIALGQSLADQELADTAKAMSVLFRFIGGDRMCEIIFRASACRSLEEWREFSSSLSGPEACVCAKALVAGLRMTCLSWAQRSSEAAG